MIMETVIIPELSDNTNSYGAIAYDLGFLWTVADYCSQLSERQSLTFQQAVKKTILIHTTKPNMKFAELLRGR